MSDFCHVCWFESSFCWLFEVIRHALFRCFFWQQALNKRRILLYGINASKKWTRCILSFISETCRTFFKNISTTDVLKVSFSCKHWHFVQNNETTRPFFPCLWNDELPRLNDSARHDEFEPTRWCAFGVAWVNNSHRVFNERNELRMFETQRKRWGQDFCPILWKRHRRRCTEDPPSFFWSWFWSMNNYDTYGRLISRNFFHMNCT